MYTCASFPGVTAAKDVYAIKFGPDIPVSSYLNELHLTLSCVLHDYGRMSYRTVSPAQKRWG